jgi:hypothetical protein
MSPNTARTSSGWSNAQASGYWSAGAVRDTRVSAGISTLLFDAKRMLMIATTPHHR